MSADGILVDLQEMEDFRDHLTPHLQQIASALTTLTHSDAPQLGSFYHAQQAEQRYEALRVDFVARLRRLILALAVSDAGIGSILDAYETRGHNSVASLKTAGDVLNDDRAARAAVRSDPVLADILRQDPQLSKVLSGGSGDSLTNAITDSSAMIRGANTDV
ncbi:hypothetical protein GCM10023322_28060 [Rugosimonospora acidiphila]|uniref:Uncharacterized protein n=1 Tax=Rugosimonospora acidiphila TaxID=556531 RepID=A0ABP9RT05_9ACTN